jgi:small subunit ribosomal protein S6
MRRYETITIIDPDLSEEDRKPVMDRISELISQQDGYLAIFDEWGSKKLAYEIKKKSHGYYVRVDYCGTGALVDEIERFFRIDDRILKYMTVLLDEEADIESIKNEIALAESKAKKAAVSSEPEPEAISEENAGPDTEIGSTTREYDPGDEFDAEPQLEKTAKDEADTKNEDQPADPGEVTAAEPAPEKTAKDEADTKSGDQPADPGDVTAAEPAPEKTAKAEAHTKSGDAPADPGDENLAESQTEDIAEPDTRSENGSGNDLNLTDDSKKEEQ